MQNWCADCTLKKSGVFLKPLLALPCCIQGLAHTGLEKLVAYFGVLLALKSAGRSCQGASRADKSSRHKKLSVGTTRPRAPRAARRARARGECPEEQSAPGSFFIAATLHDQAQEIACMVGPHFFFKGVVCKTGVLTFNLLE